LTDCINQSKNFFLFIFLQQQLAIVNTNVVILPYRKFLF
jgi:hypothetical protein